MFYNLQIAQDCAPLPSSCKISTNKFETLTELTTKQKKHPWPEGPVENKWWWPELEKGMRDSGHIANVKACRE